MKAEEYRRLMQKGSEFIIVPLPNGFEFKVKRIDLSVLITTGMPMPMGKLLPAEALNSADKEAQAKWAMENPEMVMAALSVFDAIVAAGAVEPRVARTMFEANEIRESTGEEPLLINEMDILDRMFLGAKILEHSDINGGVAEQIKPFLREIENIS